MTREEPLIARDQGGNTQWSFVRPGAYFFNAVSGEEDHPRQGWVMNIIYGRMVLSIGFSAKPPSICELVRNFNKDNGLDPYRPFQVHYGSDGGGTSQSL